MAQHIQVIDNYLPSDVFNKLRESMDENTYFPWCRSSNVNGPDWQEHEDKLGANGQFVNQMWSPLEGPSKSFHIVEKALDYFNMYAIIRIKANMLLRTPEIIYHPFHTDLGDSGIKCTTAILYLNTNNGYTHFSDGNKIESVANRIVAFPCSVSHAGTTCTDASTRTVINFNFHGNLRC
jgi:hypothetical protein